MTETTETAMNQVLALVDSNLRGLQSRDLVSASHVADMLLDLRLLLLEAELDAPVLAQ